MGFAQLLFAANAVLFFSLSYLVWLSSASLFGVALRSDASARVMAVLCITLAVISATSLFENTNTRTYIAKIFAVSHSLMFLTNTYNFLTSTIPFTAVGVHLLFALAFSVVVFLGADRFD